jgi:hypothetical protein
MVSHRRPLPKLLPVPPRPSLAGIVMVLLVAFGVSQAEAQGVGAVGGVYIDPAGMLREAGSLSQSDLRRKLGDEAGSVEPSPTVSATSALRKVSLRRLEEAVAELHGESRPLPADIRFLAGLTSIKYVFVDPEKGDVILAGPAEAWEVLPSGDVVGSRSHRPVLQLDDLIVALRYAFADGLADSFLGCSIEPTEPGLKAHAAYVRKLGGIDSDGLPQVLRGMEQALGPQDIHVYGIEGTNRFALQMIAADYRLKRISLAHDPSPSPKVPSYLDLAEKSVTGGPQKQHRWWFVGHYDAIRHTADRLAFEFEGNGLRVETAPTQTKKAAPRNTAKSSQAATQFAELATKHLPELAEKVPAFAELQNLVGLAVAGVLVRQQAEAPPARKVAARDGDEAAAESIPPARWRPAHFLDERRCLIARFDMPKQCPPLANARFVKGEFWLFSVSGGVEINPERLAGGDVLKLVSDGKLAEARKKSSEAANATRWWWD